MRFFKEQNYIIFLIYMFYTTFYNCDILCPRDGRSGGILLLFCLSFCPPLWNFNLAHNFWTVSARDFILHMSILCDNYFPLVTLFLTQSTWPWSLNHSLKTLTLPITFEHWVQELWYFTWIFLVTRPFRGYH